MAEPCPLRPATPPKDCVSAELTPHEKRARFQRILRSAKKHWRVRDGIIYCENCDNPADEVSIEVDWAGCGPCIFGEWDSLDPKTFLRTDWKPIPLTAEPPKENPHA